MKKLALLVLLTFSPIIASAVNWINFDTSNKGEKYYIDIDSLKRSGLYEYIVWEKFTDQIAKNVVRVKVNCVADSYEILDYYQYQGKKVLRSGTDINYKTVPPPDSMGYSAVSNICDFALHKELFEFYSVKREDYTDDSNFQAARFNALGFQNYDVTENMANDYIYLLNNFNPEKADYKQLIRFLNGIEIFKIKYAGLKKQ